MPKSDRSTVCGSIVVALMIAWVVPAAAEVVASRAQAHAPAPPLVELRLKDGSVIYGVVEADTPERVVVRSVSGGVITVERAQVASLEPARGEVVNGEFRPADANATRLLFTPTGRSLRKGQAYIGVYELLLPFVQVGVTDRFSIGAGTPLIFFGDSSSRPVWLTPKYQIYKDQKASAAIGVMHFVVFGEDVRMGLAYGVATIGSDDNAWTVGGGWAYSRYYENEHDPSCGPSPMGPCPPIRTLSHPGSPVVMIGGERRLSRRVKVITENYGFKAGGLISVGVRFLGERLSADLGMFAPLSTEGFFAAPVVNFVWTVGK